MSLVDADLGAAEREALLAEIQTHLPAFLSPAATERSDPVGDVGELLNLQRSDLRRVISVHLALSDPVTDFVAGLSHGLRSPLTSSERPLVATQAISGPIDWSATIRERSSTGWNEARYVVRPARRVFDIPENRALVWLLDRLDTELRRIAPAESDPQTGIADIGWFSRIVEMRARIRKAQRHHWLRGIPAERPGRRTTQRLMAARTAFYKRLIPATLQTLNRFTQKEPSPADLSKLLSQRYFEPDRDWRLFELAVALRLARRFAEESTKKRRARLLVGTGRAPYARYEMPGGDEVRLWYQSWPHDVGPSLHADARSRYKIESGPARPDIVVQRLRDGSTVDALLLELKASRRPGTLGSGLLQLLGYIKDRPALFSERPYGWLVAPPSQVFESRDAGSRELWAVSSDDVADAAVSRLTAR